PVALGLCPRWRLDPAEGPHRGHTKTRSHVFTYRLIRSSVAVLGAEEVVEGLDAGRPLWAQDLESGLPPVGDGLAQAELVDPRRLLAAMDGTVAGAAEVIPDRPLGDAEDPRRPGLRLASLLQDLDRHDRLPCELGQGSASQRAWDVQDQLWKRLACLSMDVQYDGRTEPL